MISPRLGFVTLIAALVGCSGGGGDDGGIAQPAPNQSASGIWQGTLSLGGSIVNDVHCLLTVAGELACILTDPVNDELAGAARGTIQVANGSQVGGSGTVYAAPGYALADGSSVVGGFTVTSGTVSERNTISLMISTFGQSGTIAAVFNPSYDRDSSLATVAASYSVFDIYGDPASFAIDSNGALFSQTASGCVGNGQVGVVNPQFNGYTVNVTVSNCLGLNGSYQGFAVTTDSGGTNNVFLFAAFNNLAAIVGAPLK